LPEPSVTTPLGCIAVINSFVVGVVCQLSASDHVEPGIVPVSISDCCASGLIQPVSKKSPVLYPICPLPKSTVCHSPESTLAYICASEYP